MDGTIELWRRRAQMRDPKPKDEVRDMSSSTHKSHGAGTRTEGPMHMVGHMGSK